MPVSRDLLCRFFKIVFKTRTREDYKIRYSFLSFCSNHRFFAPHDLILISDLEQEKDPSVEKLIAESMALPNRGVLAKMCAHNMKAEA